MPYYFPVKISKLKNRTKIQVFDAVVGLWHTHFTTEDLDEIGLLELLYFKHSYKNIIVKFIIN